MVDEADRFLQAIKEIQSKHAIKQIDIVLANAGYYTNDKGFTTLSYEEAEKVWKINVSSQISLRTDIAV